MKIHLIKSDEVDTTLFTKVVDFLQNIPGPIQFLYEENAISVFEDEEVYLYTIRDKKHFEKKNNAHFKSE